MSIKSYAVISGAAGGVGRAIAVELKNQNYSLCLLVKQKDDARVMDLVTEDDTTIVCDLADKTSRSEAWRSIHSWSSQIDVLVNAAGIAYGATSLMTPYDDLRKVFEINYYAAIDLSQRVARAMLRRNKGVILNISSIQGESGRSGSLAYGGSKAALNHMTRVMGNELGQHGIRVNAIAPTIIETSMLEKMDIAARDRLIEESALSTILKPEQVADLVSFLVSERASQINGQVINLDGGIL